MSTITLDPPVAGPVAQGMLPISFLFPRPESSLSLLINAFGSRYELEARIVGSPVIEDNKITARFIVDDDVYLGLNLTGQSIQQDNKFTVGRFSIFYKIEEHRPRAQFVADTLMAVIGLAGRLDLKMSEPDVSTDLHVESSLLEISKMLHRRQTAYRLMVIEMATGKQFLLPSVMSEREIERISFVYHAIVDRSFTWSGGSSSIQATPEYAASFAHLVQPFEWSMPVEFLSETVLDQAVSLGPATVTMEDAVITNIDEVRSQLEIGDGRQVILEISSLSKQDKYEFTETVFSSGMVWEPKLQALIDLESYLDAAIVERYHALAAATLAGLTEEEKKEVTARPELGEAFLIGDSDGE